MRTVLILQLLGLLALANGTPVVAKKLLGSWIDTPLDGGARLFDGQPLLGHSKTIRGIALSLVVTTAAAPLVGLGWTVGLLVALVAMAGDLFSSFLKRRFRLTPSSQSIGLDQVPESLFPLLACQGLLDLTAAEIAATVVLFFVGELAISRVLYWLHIRDRPY